MSEITDVLRGELAKVKINLVVPDDAEPGWKRVEATIPFDQAEKLADHLGKALVNRVKEKRKETRRHVRARRRPRL